MRVSADSSCRQQSREPDQVVGRRFEDKHPLNPLHSTQLGVRHAGNLFNSGICFVDPLTNDSNDLAEPIASVPRPPPIDV